MLTKVNYLIYLKYSSRHYYQVEHNTRKLIYLIVFIKKKNEVFE